MILRIVGSNMRVAITASVIAFDRITSRTRNDEFSAARHREPAQHHDHAPDTTPNIDPRVQYTGAITALVDFFSIASAPAGYRA